MFCLDGLVWFSCVVISCGFEQLMFKQRVFFVEIDILVLFIEVVGIGKYSF